MSDIAAGRIQDDLRTKSWGPGNIQWWYSRFLCLGILAVTVGAIWAWQHRSDTVRTQRLELVGPDGRVSAVVGPVAGGTGLALKDEKSQTRATMSITPLGNPRLDLQGDDGTPRAGIEVSASGQSTLRLFDREGAVRLALHVMPDGSSKVEVSDLSGKSISSFKLDGTHNARPVDMNTQRILKPSENRGSPPPAPPQHRKPLAITEGSQEPNVQEKGAAVRRMID